MYLFVPSIVSLTGNHEQISGISFVMKYCSVSKLFLCYSGHIVDYVLCILQNAAASWIPTHCTLARILPSRVGRAPASKRCMESNGGRKTRKMILKRFARSSHRPKIKERGFCPCAHCERACVSCRCLLIDPRCTYPFAGKRAHRTASKTASPPSNSNKAFSYRIPGSFLVPTYQDVEHLVTNFRVRANECSLVEEGAYSTSTLC